MCYTDKVYAELEIRIQEAIDNGATSLFDVWYHIYFNTKLPVSYETVETAYSDIVEVKVQRHLSYTNGVWRSGMRRSMVPTKRRGKRTGELPSFANPMAVALRDPRYRNRMVKSKVVYDRKRYKDIKE